MAGEWTFTIPMQPPSANAHVVNGNNAASAGRYRRLRNTMALVLRVCGRGIPQATNGRRLVTLTRLIGPRQNELDYDNWVSACKPLVDAMKPERFTQRKGGMRFVAGTGWLVDDSSRWVTVTYLQQRAEDGKPATRITISEAT